VQHLAFSTGDIFATAAVLKANGFRPLPMSPNYYDDIEARFGLDGELMGRLRAENILYDRDQQGEYFQLYCPTYGDGFIFEVVERRGSYAGYGAANASFRIAAQKRHLTPAAACWSCDGRREILHAAAQGGAPTAGFNRRSVVLCSCFVHTRAMADTDPETPEWTIAWTIQAGAAVASGAAPQLCAEHHRARGRGRPFGWRNGG
jgi:hypothetical protein